MKTIPVFGFAYNIKCPIFYIIYNLVKERKMTLDGAKKKLKENKEDTINNIEVLRSLESIKQMLIEVKEQL